MSVICDVESHFILAFGTRRGPKPDVAEFKSLLDEALSRVRLTSIVADAGYDSESNHCHARKDRQNAPAVLVRLLSGGNAGKMIVKVGEEPG